MFVQRHVGLFFIGKCPKASWNIDLNAKGTSIKPKRFAMIFNRFVGREKEFVGHAILKKYLCDDVRGRNNKSQDYA